MDIKLFAGRASKLAIDNSPAIFTGVGVAGVVATGYLSARAAFKASAVLRYESLPPRAEEPETIEFREAFHLTWHLYLPAVGTGALSIAAIVAANRVGTRRAAALAAAYTLSEKAFVEYREKIVEKIGEKKERDYKDEIAHEQVTRNPNSAVVIIEGSDVLCFDAYTGRYFKSTMETLRKAENDVNAQLLHDGYASLSDFYERIGLETTSMTEEVGWTTDKLLSLSFTTSLSNDKPCIVITFRVAPIRHYNQYN